MVLDRDIPMRFLHTDVFLYTLYDGGYTHRHTPKGTIQSMHPSWMLRYRMRTQRVFQLGTLYPRTADARLPHV